ncbi:MAG: tRNA (adenosine(37)-N6)-threonylcarbamoyltransferase complex dimerization subunit type 1 TsaB [Clostridia bacterium]|nr:tRNA (adenosine(37)-N6)-threonylcarbamoyltransferase complex dimerization subunit type 1 TsaB [Clostridia bacterium]
MKALVIDSTADRLVIIGINGEKEEIFVGESGARRHTGSILIAIEKVLEKCHLQPMELNYIGVVVGPGSFTGIRIGVATANAMAFASRAKVVQITSLEPVIFGKETGLALLDCKHNNFYALARQDGKDSYLSLSGTETDNYGIPKYIIDKPLPVLLISVFKDKIAKSDFVVTARPFYLKKSSAELLC